MKPYLLLAVVYGFAPWIAAHPAEAAEPEPAPIVHRDLPYAATSDPKQTLDVYSPADAKAKKRPIVFWIHGGGWTGGDKRDVAHKPAAFVAKNYVFVSINYRLFPSVPLKTIAADVARAIRWTHDHAAEFGGDGKSIFVMGHSAGAQLAALACTDERYLAAEGLPLSIIKGCVPVDGDTYDVRMEIAAEIPKNKELHRAKFGDQKSQRNLSPVAYVSSGKSIPPFLFLFVADHPETSAQARRLANLLRSFGYSAECIAVENSDHKKINERVGLPDDEPTEAVLEFLAEPRFETSMAAWYDRFSDSGAIVLVRARAPEKSGSDRKAKSPVLQPIGTLTGQFDSGDASSLPVRPRTSTPGYQVAEYYEIPTSGTFLASVVCDNARHKSEIVNVREVSLGFHTDFSGTDSYLLCRKPCVV